jgi:CubicO group peptidase (beta-lactamase class C family)
VGSRSRVWSYDIDVTYRDGAISWAHHEGHLNPARDTMWVSKEYRGDRSEWMWVRRRGADSLAARLFSVEEKPFEYGVPPEEGVGWACADPGSVGLEQDPLFDFLDTVASGEFGDIHSFLVVRHDTLVVEEYFAESGSKHGAFVSSVFRDRVHLLSSITMPVVSALGGIAIENGFIGSVGDPVSQFLPSHASLFRGGKEAITIEHLLTMSPGLAWSQTSRSGRVSDAQALWETDDLVKSVLEKPLTADPGTRFRYSNGTAAMMGTVLESATGMGIGRFAEEYLFGPLGITDYEWGSYPDGTVVADGGLALRPRDLAKIGQMYLDHGRWSGVQVLPADWVDRSTVERFRYGAVGEVPMGYGYFWNLAEFPFPGGRLSSYFHSGSGGQFLIVIPELDMVVVFTGGTYGGNVSGTFVPIVTEYILTSVDLHSGSR